MFWTQRRFAKVGLFFAVLVGAFVSSTILAPSAHASGEYYQYIPQDTSIRVQGGNVLAGPGKLTRTGGQTWAGAITVLGNQSRVGAANDPSVVPAPCQYTLELTYAGVFDPTSTPPQPEPGVNVTVSPNNFTVPLGGGGYGEAPGQCRFGHFTFPGDLKGTGSIEPLMDKPVTINIVADPRGAGAGTGAPTCPPLNGAGFGGIYVVATGNCAYVKSLQPGGACPAGSTEGVYTDTAGKPVAACIAAAVGGGGGTVPDDCEIKPGEDFRWLFCPVLDIVNGALSFVDDFIDEYLQTDNRVFAVGSKYKDAWAVFRNIAIGLIIIAGLVTLISEALGLGIVDAYTVRKVLPRLLIAVIGVSLSWEFAKFMTGLFDDLGQAAGSIIYTSFLPGVVEINIASLLVGGGLVGGVAYVGIFTLGLGAIAGGFILSLLGTLLIAMLVGAAVLVLRQGIIVALILLAPLAIAAFILPNTSKLANFWWTTFISMLMLYPIATGIIALCKVLGLLTMGAQGTSSAPLAALTASIVGLFFFFAGYAMLPLAFRLAGGAVATIGGIANDKTKGIFDGRKKARQAMMNEGKQKAGADILARRTGMAGTLAGMADKIPAGSTGRLNRLRRGGYRAAAGVVGGRNGVIDNAAQQERANKLAEQISNNGPDGELRGFSVDTVAANQTAMAATASADGNTYSQNGLRRLKDDKLQYKTLGGGWADATEVATAKSRWGNDVYMKQASLAYEMKKASTEDEIRDLSTRYAGLATSPGGWGMSEAQAAGNWSGAAFANQNKHLELKRASWKTGRMDSPQSRDAFVDEIYENRGSYNMSQMGSNTVEALKNSHIAAAATANDTTASTEVRRAARDRQRKIAAISETFMHDIGGVGGQFNPGSEQVDITTVGGAANGRRQVSSQGSAHLAERVAELAHETRTMNYAPDGSYDYASHRPGTRSANQRGQKSYSGPPGPPQPPLTPGGPPGPPPRPE